MKILEKEVFLIKSSSNLDVYVDKLEAEGFTVKQLSAISIETVNTEDLTIALRNHNQYSGIIFTSRRSIEATIKATIIEPHLIDHWRDKENFAIGESTYLFALNSLHLRCKGKDTGNAKNLAKLITEKRYDKKLLYLCGNLARDDISRSMKECKIKFDTLIVYRTLCNPEFENDLKGLTDNYTHFSEYCVFFSPSAVEYSKQAMQKIRDQFELIKFISFGPSTEEAMIENSMKVFGKLERPSPTGLVDFLLDRAHQQDEKSNDA